MKKIDVPTSQEIDALFALAEAGDASALSALYDMNKSMAKTANSRMSYLESKDQGSAVYSRAQYWLGEERGKTRFSESRRMDIDDLREQMDIEAQFLRSKDSTITGERERINRMFDSLEDHGYIDMPDDPKEKRAYKKRMEKFLKSDIFVEFKKYFGSAIIGGASEIIQDGGDLEELILLYQEMEELGDYDLFDVWDGWREGKRHLTDR